MTIPQFENKQKLLPWLMVLALIPLTLGIGVGVVWRPSLIIGGPLLMVGGIFTIKLLTKSRQYLWKMWLGVIAIAAFGPFLDLVTHRPINWGIGLVAFAFLPALFIRTSVLPQPTTRQPSTGGRRQLPILGSAFLLYMGYLLLQALRPDVQTWSALLALRPFIIGLVAYFVTGEVFQACTSKKQVIATVGQFLHIFLAIGLIVALYGLFQFAVGPSRLQSLGLLEANVFHNQRNLNGGTAIFRINSTLRRNEVLAVFMYLNIVSCAAAIRLAVGPRWLIRGSLVSSIAALLLSFSLTNLVVLGLWLGLVILTTDAKRLQRLAFRFSTAILLIVLIVNYMLGGLIQTRFAEHVLDTREGIGRVSIFLMWGEEMSERPFLQGMAGSGICLGLDNGTAARIGGTLDTLGLSVADRNKCGWQRPISDNWYATHSLEVGWFGLALIWLVFGVVAVYILPRLRQRWPEPERSAWTMLALGILALWPTGFVGALFLYMPITLYFWTLVGIVDGVSRQRYAKTEGH